MVQYDGIIMLRNEDGVPVQLNIDLRVHGEELDAFMCTHGLASVEQWEMARSVTGEQLFPSYAVSDQALQHVHYLPEVKAMIQKATSGILKNERTHSTDLAEGGLDILLLQQVARSLTPIPSKKEPTPKAFVRYCGKDTFWTRFKIDSIPGVIWFVFYTIHDEGIVLVRHISYIGENEDDL